ncbi:MAG: tetratricopeptide repeat protein [Proteobacteria bacterium]|nr:tetratricopeptide repeat protein [Pseudomonadota bacterium]
MRRFSAVLLLGLALGGAAAGAAEPLDTLFQRLQATKDKAEAKAIEQQIWQEWILAGTDVVDLLMGKGIREMQAGAYDAALETFDSVIALQPEVAEGWNKRATVHFLMGNFDASVADIEKTLEREPRHFGALSGLGMIYEALENDEGALKAYEATLAINPHIDGLEQKVRGLLRKVRGERI